MFVHYYNLNTIYFLIKLNYLLYLILCHCKIINFTQQLQAQYFRLYYEYFTDNYANLIHQMNI